MPEKQPNHPNLNKGGNNGNAFGAGSPRKAFRIAAAKAAEKQLKHWIDVAAGNKVIVEPSLDGQKGTTRYPTHDEQERAYKDILLRFGIGTQDEVLMVGDTRVFEALGAMLPEFVAPDRIEAFLKRLKELIGDDS